MPYLGADSKESCVRLLTGLCSRRALNLSHATRVWYLSRSSGGQNKVYVYLSQCSSAESLALLPIASFMQV